MSEHDLVEAPDGKIYRVIDDPELGMCLYNPYTGTKEKVTKHNEYLFKVLFQPYV